MGEFFNPNISLSSSPGIVTEGANGSGKGTDQESGVHEMYDNYGSPSPLELTSPLQDPTALEIAAHNLANLPPLNPNELSFQLTQILFERFNEFSSVEDAISFLQNVKSTDVYALDGCIPLLNLTEEIASEACLALARVAEADSKDFFYFFNSQQATTQTDVSVISRSDRKTEGIFLLI